jgi:hypothetical protein
MLPTTKLTSTALLVAIMSVAGCNSGSKHASATNASSGGAGVAPALAAASQPAAAPSSAPAAGGASAAEAGCPLTGAQATSAMGETYADPTSAYGICSYLSSNNAFTITVHDASGLFTYAGTLATAKQDQMTDTTTPIPGLGDQAAGTGLEVVVAAGGKTIDIRNADQTPSGGWPKSVALAKLVIAALH